MVRIFGTNDFYWDNENNIVLHYPTDENKEIRIGKYDGTNYGIAFTTDGGDTWQSAIGFDGVVLSTSDQTRLTNLETTVGDEDSGLAKDVIDAESSISLNSEQIALRVENTTYYKNVPIYLSTDPALTWSEEQKVNNVGYLWYQISTNITWRWNGLAWINTSPIDSYDDPSLVWSSSEKLANIGYLWGDKNGESVLNKQWTGTNWTTNLTSNNTSWSQVASSQIIQTADSISTKVSKGSIISEINQSAEAVSIIASKINLNGVVTANENFKILSDGSMEAVNGKFAGNLTAENTYCNNLFA